MKKAIALAGMITLAAQINAGTICDPRYTAYTDPSTACELGTTNNDSEAQVNLDSLFGSTEWQYIWKDEDGGQVDPITEFVLDNDRLGGNFTIDWTATTNDNLLFVLKDGAGDPDTYVGWLLEGTGIETYDFITPFLNSNMGVSEAKQISHASFYGYTSEDEPGINSNIPVPATLPLMGVGLLLLRRHLTKEA